MFVFSWCVVQCLRLLGAVVLSGSWDRSLRVWDAVVGICTHVLLGHTEGAIIVRKEIERVLHF